MMNKSNNHKKRFRTYSKSQKDDKMFILILVIIATIFIMLPCLLDQLTHHSRLSTIHKMQLAIYNSNQLSVNIISLWSLFQTRLLYIFNQKAVPDNIKKITDDIKK